jgi:hypothetical protein
MAFRKVLTVSKADILKPKDARSGRAKESGPRKRRTDGASHRPVTVPTSRSNHSTCFAMSMSRCSATTTGRALPT